MKYILLLLLSILTLNANITQDETLKKLIGRMLVVGFENEKIDENSKIVKDIQKYDLGGVILFDKFYDDRSKTKNISSPDQVQRLTRKLQMFTKKELFIAVDQEGGKVARLKPEYGFKETPSAFKVSQMGVDDVKALYERQSYMLKLAGINLNFAPVVDLSTNPENKVIVGLERSFGSNPNRVSYFAQIMMEEQKKQGITSVLKHFPGHGSSLEDSHQGFVDITNTWSTKELEPYEKLINETQVDMIMTAHVFNKYLDQKYPATLSYRVNTL